LTSTHQPMLIWQRASTVKTLTTQKKVKENDRFKKT